MTLSIAFYLANEIKTSLLRIETGEREREKKTLRTQCDIELNQVSFIQN